MDSGTVLLIVGLDVFFIVIVMVIWYVIYQELLSKEYSLVTRGLVSVLPEKVMLFCFGIETQNQTRPNVIEV